jgi:hypothetical protein
VSFLNSLRALLRLNTFLTRLSERREGKGRGAGRRQSAGGEGRRREEEGGEGRGWKVKKGELGRGGRGKEGGERERVGE